MTATTNIGTVRVPSRFESLRDTIGHSRISQVLIEPQNDLPRLKKWVAEVRTANQGKIAFVVGQSGVGKTSLIESMSIFLADSVSSLLSAPANYEVPLTGLVKWLNDKLVKVTSKDNKITVCNLDGREVLAADDATGNNAMVDLNAFLRKTPGVLLLWPVANLDFANKAIAMLQQAGGGTALSGEPIYTVQGLDKTKYYDVLTLILRASSMTLEDAAVSQGEAREVASRAISIGDYLERIQSLVVARYDVGALGTLLPKLTICITSDGDTSDICRQLRRGSGYLLDPDRVLQFSRSNVAEDWKRDAGLSARKSLAFVSSLFEVKLVNLSGSAVANACAFCEDSELQRTVRSKYPHPVSSNATNLIKASSLVRALMGTSDVGKSATTSSAQVVDAYRAIQALSKTKHKEINKAILRVIVDKAGHDLPDLEFEKQPLTGKGLTADVWFKRGDRPETIEFTHREEKMATEAVLSTYLLGKVRDYARDYGLL